MSNVRDMLRSAAIFVLLLLGGATPALADEKSEMLVHAFVTWVDSSPDWSASVGVVRSSGRDTFAEGLVFARSNGDISTSIEMLRLRDLAEWGDGGFTATGMWLSRAAIVGPHFEYAIPAAKVESVTMPGTMGVTFDPRRLMSFFAQAYSAFADAEFSNLSIPEMTVSSEQVLSDTGASVSTRLAYAGVAVAGLRNGVIERVEAGPVTMHTRAPDGDFELVVESVSSDRTDLGGLAHVFDPAAYVDGQGDGVWTPILSNVAYSGISGAGPGGLTFEMNSLALEELVGRQLGEPSTGLWDQLLDPSVAGDTKADLALDLARTHAAWRLGGVRLSGLGIRMPARSASVSLEDLTASELSSERLDSLALTGLRVDLPELFLRLGSLELAGFSSPDLEALLGFAALESNVDPKMHAEAISKTLAAFPRFSHFGLADLIGGRSEAEAASLESLTLDLDDWNDIFAESTDLRVSGLTVPASLRGAETTRLMHALGYDDIVLGIALSDRWTPQTGTDEATWTITLRNGGELQLSYRLTGVTLEWMVDATAVAGASDDSEKALEAMLKDLRLQRASVSFTDHSLLERAFGYAAEVQELDVDGKSYREQMRAALPFLISAAMPPAITKLLAKPLQQFLSGRQTLIAEINPATPLNMTELFAETDDPLALPERLNMSVRTEAPAQ